MRASQSTTIGAAAKQSTPSTGGGAHENRRALIKPSSRLGRASRAALTGGRRRRPIWAAESLRTSAAPRQDLAPDGVGGKRQPTYIVVYVARMRSARVPTWAARAFAGNLLACQARGSLSLSASGKLAGWPGRRPGAHPASQSHSRALGQSRANALAGRIDARHTGQLTSP